MIDLGQFKIKALKQFGAGLQRWQIGKFICYRLLLGYFEIRFFPTAKDHTNE